MQFVLFKDFNKWCITPKDNYDAYCSDARKYMYIENCESQEDAVDCFETYIKHDGDTLKIINNFSESAKKKKKPTLPNGMNMCILPDHIGGMDNFNNSADTGAMMCESISPLEVDGVYSDIIQTTIEVMTEYFGEDGPEYCDFELEDLGDCYRIEVRANLSYNSMENLTNKLDNIIQAVDRNAYFEMEDDCIATCFIHKKGADILETFKRIDRERFCNCEPDYDLGGLYESIKSNLSSDDKSKLKSFVDKTDDVEEINTYLTGLLNKR